MRIDLTPSQTWSQEVGHGGVEVRIVAGEVWLTRERDPEDHVLLAPAVFESGMHGRMVVLALTVAQLDVTPLTRSVPMSGDQPAHAA